MTYNELTAGGKLGIEEKTELLRKNKMRKHKNRSISPKFKKRKSKAKKKKKDMRIKQTDTPSMDSLKLRRNSNSNSQSADKMNVRYGPSGNNTMECEDAEQKYRLPAKLMKEIDCIRYGCKLSLVQKSGRVWMNKRQYQNQLDSEHVTVLTRHDGLSDIYHGKNKFLGAKYFNKRRSRNSRSDRSTSHSKYKVRHCNQSSLILENIYSYKNPKTFETNKNTDITLKENQSTQIRSKTFNSLSMSNYHERYSDILYEVKKILKRDVINKRKLKYIFKRQHILMRPNIESRSSSEHELYVAENKHDKKQEDQSEVESNTLKQLQSNVVAKTQQKLNVTRVTSNKSSANDNVVSYKTTSLTLKANMRRRLNVASRTPSPARPLKRDDVILEASVDRLSSIKKISNSDKLTASNFESCKNLEYVDEYSEYLMIEKNLLNTTKVNIESPMMKNPYSKIIEDSFNSKKSSYHVRQYLSFQRLDSSVQLESLHSPPTSLYNSADNIDSSPIFPLENKNSYSVLEENPTTAKKSEESIVNSAQSSPSRSSFISERSKSKNLRSHSSLEDHSGYHRSRSRSISLSRSLSRSVSRNSGNTQYRSYSKGSTHTFTSSTRHSGNSYFNSSRSTSSTSNRTSRPLSSCSSRNRSPSIPRRYGSPSFLDRRRITSARKRPIPYHRPTPSPLSSRSSTESSDYNNWSTKSHKSSPASTYSSPNFIN